MIWSVNFTAFFPPHHHNFYTKCFWSPFLFRTQWVVVISLRKKNISQYITSSCPHPPNFYLIQWSLKHGPTPEQANLQTSQLCNFKLKRLTLCQLSGFLCVSLLVQIKQIFRLYGTIRNAGHF